ncbi:MAG TPA: glycosyltransferase family 4 protein [Holophagaceae bacterium]|nr:glycosyltransferase family 4 protein [Holophagaceae bacterium]
MKHIVFAHRKLSFGGGERVLIEQVAALAPLPVKVSVIYRKDGPRRDIEPELRERNPNLGEVLHLPGAWAAGRYLARTRPDLLVLCNHKGVQRALPWIRRIPTLVTLHEHYERHLRKYKGIASRVDRWICTYDFTEAVARHLGPAPCSIIHPLYPRPEAAQATQAERQAARRALGLPEAGLVIGYAGQIDGRKDPEALLGFSVSLEARLGGPLQVLMAGREDAETRARLDTVLAKHPMAAHIHRLGALPDLGQAFTALDLYVMTSRNEGFFPLALIEALERGVPVLAPTVGGIGTVLKDGEGGFLIRKPDDRKSIPMPLLAEAAERLAPLLADPAAWESQRQQAHAFGVGLTKGYDAQAKFREAVSAWL